MTFNHHHNPCNIGLLAARHFCSWPSSPNGRSLFPGPFAHLHLLPATANSWVRLLNTIRSSSSSRDPLHGWMTISTPHWTNCACVVGPTWSPALVSCTCKAAGLSQGSQTSPGPSSFCWAVGPQDGLPHQLGGLVTEVSRNLGQGRLRAGPWPIFADA